MATNGNHPTQELEQRQLKAVAEAATGPIADFMTRVENAAELLASVGHELGGAGGQDERELVACAEQLRGDAQRTVEKILARIRRRVGDLERVLGSLK